MGEHGGGIESVYKPQKRDGRSMKQKNGSTSLFLIELVLVILIFSLCAAVTMKAFATAKMMTQTSDELSNAVTAAQSAAECYKAFEGNLVSAAEILNGTVKDRK